MADGMRVQSVILCLCDSVFGLKYQNTEHIAYTIQYTNMDDIIE